jgi:16S rRNA (uracil1498-N3)-methyltransferase
MHRFHVPPEHCRGDRVTLGEGDRRHAVRVLRLQAGETIEVLDGAGTLLACRIFRADRESVEASVLFRERVPQPPPVLLAAALLKGKAMDFLVQKATELGAATLQPLALERCVARVEPGEAEDKVAGWKATAVEACKQCGNPWMPRFEPPRSLTSFLSQRAPGLMMVASLAGQPRLPGAILREFGKPPGAVTIVTGPEGDLTESELDQLTAAGTVPFTLGPLVLRGETAALAALAIVQHEMRMMRVGSGE